MPLKLLWKHGRKLPIKEKKELFETVCFKLIENGDFKGNLHHAIPDIAEHLEEVANELRGKGLIPPIPSTDTASDEIIPETDDDTDLLGGEETTIDPYYTMAAAIRSSDVKLGGLVKQVIDEQKSLEAEKKSSLYLVNTLAKVSKLLNEVIISGLNESASTEGVNSQLDSVKEYINTIEKWLESK